MSFLATNAELLLIHRDMPQISQAKAYDLMLTPQFYISKREELPVKYLYQAIRLAPSILDELTHGDDYSYTAIKEDTGWILIAYSPDEIVSFMESKGLSKNQIGKIYFAQQSKDYFESVVSIDSKNAIMTVNNSVVMVPREFVKSEKFISLTEEARPDKGIRLKSGTSSILGSKQAIVISILLLLLSVGYIAEGLRYQKSLSTLDERVDRLKSKYPSLKNRSTLVLDSIYKSDYVIDSLQRKIRDRLKAISSLTSKNSKIDKLKIDDKGYAVTISSDKKTMKKLLKYAKTKNLKVNSSSGSLVLKGAL